MMDCALCGKEAAGTKEHVWSNVLLRLVEDEAPLTFDPIREKVRGVDPVIKDLCADCNNVRLSPMDAVIDRFAERHLLKPIPKGIVLDLSDPLLERWVFKTVANHERTQPASNDPRRQLWRSLVPSILEGAAPPAEVDLWFAPWEDLTGTGIAERLNLVHRLDARELLLRLDALPEPELQAQYAASWGLKVAHGVFALVFWQPGIPGSTRAAVDAELRSYGWLGMEAGQRVTRSPYNVYTSAMFNVICDPARLPSADGKLVPVAEAKSAAFARVRQLYEEQAGRIGNGA